MWDKILGPDGNLIQGTKEIQNQQVIFYKNLFTSQNINEDKSFFLSNPEVQLSQNSKNDSLLTSIFDLINKCVIVSLLSQLI